MNRPSPTCLAPPTTSKHRQQLALFRLWQHFTFSTLPTTSIDSSHAATVFIPCSQLYNHLALISIQPLA